MCVFLQVKEQYCEIPGFFFFHLYEAKKKMAGKKSLWQVNF